MDTSWIQVFILTLSECVAPSGKAVCQQQEVQYEFVDRAECEAVLEELMDYKASDENVIVNSARCLPSARERPTFASLEEANRELSGTADWSVLPAEAREQQAADLIPSDEETLTAHQRRLENLPECDQANSVTPCKVGQIIVESDTERELEVWRQDEQQ